MWLLNSCSWEMKEFISHKQAPPYAILSHTWGDEEVSFRDWQKAPWEEVERNEGFSKIKNCCQQAAADGFEWTWIDTCCIDKRSSAELSEAINSMFQWYKSAGVCYAYLCDVPDNIEFNLAGCRWITRGWTLQELIAPREVVFYSSDWQALGTRSELSACLATVTRISEPFLIGKRPIDEASIAQRMSWAAMRSTSREEDEAYCLLGLFNVNLPLIYGEGLKAFRRLQEVLVREYPEDHSLFAWGRIVKQISDQANDEELLTSEPLYRKESIGEVEDELHGLFAGSPDDFKYAGQVVCIPNARGYLPLISNTVSVLSGRTVRVNLPKVLGCYIIKRSRYLPILQVFRTSLIVLLCGQWNDSQTDFHHIVIPTIADDLHYSRFEQIICSNQYNYQEFTKMTKTFNITPMTQQPSGVRSGEVIMRRNISYMDYTDVRNPAIDLSYSRGSIRIPESEKGSLMSASFYNNEGYGFLISTIRLEPLNHSHGDDIEGRNCGRLGFRFNPFALLGSSTQELIVLTKEGDFMEPLAKEKMNLRFFQNTENARIYGYYNWREMTCRHDMLVPRDEWRLSVIGLADVYISVERVFLNDYDIDDGSDTDGSHPFVDVLDMVISRNKIRYNTVEGNVDDGDRVEGIKDKDEMGTRVIGEGDADEDRTKNGKVTGEGDNK